MWRLSTPVLPGPARNGFVHVVDPETGERLAKLPVLRGTRGPDAIDVRTLHAQSGMFCYDPGYMATASCESTITYVDGDKGELLYRGYPIEQLAEKSNFLEVCYLILTGDLPEQKAFDKFSHDITHHTMLHEQVNFLFRGFRRDAHPMALMVGIVGALSAFYAESSDVASEHQRMISAHRLLAKMPTVAAMAYKWSIGQPFVYPMNRLGYAENLLHMMFAVPCEDYVVNSVLARAMDLILILHAEHEQNASTSTVRLAGSSGANPFASVASGIASLWGPAHGGANEAVLQMLEDIGSLEKIPEFLDRAKDKDDSMRLMGFGHRVYKNYDPRAKIMREACHQVLDELDARDDPYLRIAMELEKIALDDSYFVSRSLYPNVDFYSGIILKAMGIPRHLFTAVFAVARTVGWIAQWNEMHVDVSQRIGRPRQIYTGNLKRDYIPIDAR